METKPKDRYTDYLAYVEKQAEQRLANGAITPEKLAKLSENLSLTELEHIQYSKLARIALADTLISETDSKLILSALGTSKEEFNAQPVAVKSTVTTVIGELLEKFYPDNMELAQRFAGVML